MSIIEDLEDLTPFKEAVAKLKSLETEEEVAEFLENQGARGYRFAPGVCPIAQYVRRSIPAGHRVCVEEGEISVFNGKTLMGNIVYSTDVTTAMSDFITDFDSGSYKNLRVNLHDIMENDYGDATHS